MTVLEDRVPYTFGNMLIFIPSDSEDIKLQYDQLLIIATE
jgi:hypothetical protein